jgi:hypothetical protein
MFPDDDRARALIDSIPDTKEGTARLLELLYDPDVLVSHWAKDRLLRAMREAWSTFSAEFDAAMTWSPETFAAALACIALTDVRKAARRAAGVLEVLSADRAHGELLGRVAGSVAAFVAICERHEGQCDEIARQGEPILEIPRETRH